jgi:hypothetical protein
VLFGSIFLVTALAALRLLLIFDWILPSFVQNAFGNILVLTLGFLYFSDDHAGVCVGCNGRFRNFRLDSGCHRAGL